MRPFKTAAALGFAALVVAAVIVVIPDALPRLLTGLEQRPFTPVLVTACWLVATAASIAGKRALADGILSWPGIAAAHIVGSVSNRVVPGGAGAGGVYLIALRRGGMPLATASAMVILWAAASGLVHTVGAAIAGIWLRAGPLAVGGVLLCGSVGAWLVRRRRARRTPASANLDGDSPASCYASDLNPGVCEVPEPHVQERAEPATADASPSQKSMPWRRCFWSLQALKVRSWLAIAARAIRGVVTTIKARPRLAVAAIIAQAAATSCLAFGFALASASFGIEIAITTAMAAYVAATAASVIVPTPAGIGSADTALVAALVFVGASLGDAIPVVLVFRAVILLAPVVVAALMALVWAVSPRYRPRLRPEAAEQEAPSPEAAPVAPVPIVASPVD